MRIFDIMKELENIIYFFLFLDGYLREGFTASYALERATYDYQKKFTVTGKRVGTGAVDKSDYETIVADKFCSNCGRRYLNGEDKCKKCGKTRSGYKTKQSVKKLDFN